MKTVIDAVNYFKGYWNSSCGTCLWYYKGNEKYIFGNSAHGENLVCTEKEFNKCVEEMSNLVPVKPMTKTQCENCNHYFKYRAEDINIACPNCGDYIMPPKVKITAEPVKPIYTQAMCDKGEKVKVGMRFTTETNLFYTAELVNDKSVCFTDEDGFLIGITINAPKPIDTRTDEEKAISDIKNYYCDHYDPLTAMEDIIFKGIKSGKFNGVKWVGES